MAHRNAKYNSYFCHKKNLTKIGVAFIGNHRLSLRVKVAKNSYFSKVNKTATTTTLQEAKYSEEHCASWYLVILNSKASHFDPTIF